MALPRLVIFPLSPANSSRWYHLKCWSTLCNRIMFASGSTNTAVLKSYRAFHLSIGRNNKARLLITDIKLSRNLYYSLDEVKRSRKYLQEIFDFHLFWRFRSNGFLWFDRSRYCRFTAHWNWAITLRYLTSFYENSFMPNYWKYKSCQVKSFNILPFLLQFFMFFYQIQLQFLSSWWS